MCIKIIGDTEQEFDPKCPLENQVLGAKEIIVDYDPCDLKLMSFVGQMELMVKNGVSLNADIKFNANNNLDGIRLERYIDKLKIGFETNEIFRKLSILYSTTDKKLSEMSEICIGKANE